MATINTGTIFMDAVNNVVQLLKDNAATTGIGTLNVYDSMLPMNPTYPSLCVKFAGSSQDWVYCPTVMKYEVALEVYVFTENLDLTQAIKDGVTNAWKVTKVLEQNFDVNGWCVEEGSAVQGVSDPVPIRGQGGPIVGVIIRHLVRPTRNVTLSS